MWQLLGPCAIYTNQNKLTKWNVAIFISAGIRCMAPRSSTINIRIATVVSCCRDTAVRKVYVNRCIANCWSQRPQATRSSAACRAQRSAVLTSYLSRFTFWTKCTFTRYRASAEFNIAVKTVLIMQNESDRQVGIRVERNTACNGILITARIHYFSATSTSSTLLEGVIVTAVISF